MRPPLFQTALCLLLAVLTEGKSVQRQKVLSDTGYIEYSAGTVNVILAAPHGGALQPPEIPARPPAGCMVSGICVYSPDCEDEDERCRTVSTSDLYTIDLTDEIADEIQRLLGGRPHVVINLLHRSRLDANRDIDEAAFGNPVAEEAWHEFHNFINQSKAAISGRGMFFDIHGHGHPEPWAELGYLHSGAELDLGIIPTADSSIRSIAELRESQGTSYEEVLRGTTSFGGCLNDLDYAAVPSPDDPSPLGASYFSGGYNTQRHGSRDGGLIDAIQIESPRVLREDLLRPQYAIDLATCIQRFMNTHHPSS